MRTNFAQISDAIDAALTPSSTAERYGWTDESWREARKDYKQHYSEPPKEKGSRRFTKIFDHGTKGMLDAIDVAELPPHQNFFFPVAPSLPRRRGATPSPRCRARPVG
jgi:hypothetical protein